jgi:hypothetical protein
MAQPKNVRNFTSILRAGGLLHRGRRMNGTAVINKTGSDIAIDKLVAISGYDVTSKLPKVVLADADSAGLAVDVFVTLQTLTNGKSGNVFKGGTSTANLNTNGVTSVGDPVYLDVTAGAFTATLPTANNSVVQIVGYTMVKSATVGQIAWDIGPVSKISDQSLNSDVKVLAATFTTVTNVLASLSGFSWTLQAGATYQFEVNLATTQTTNGGLSVAFKYTTATLTSIQLQTYQSTAVDNTLAISSQSTTTTDATKFIDNKTSAFILSNLKGTLVVNAGGTVAVQVAQNTTNSDTTSVLLGSYGRFTRVA